MITSFVNIASEIKTAIKRLNWRNVLKSSLVAGCCFLVFNSSFGQVSGDFRSNGNVTFAALANWEIYNGSAWVAAGAAPVQGDNVITIRTGNTATVTANKTLDQVVVASGGVLTINSGQTLTIANGAGTDLNVSGIINNSGTITPTGTIVFNASSTYNHTQDGGTIPVATWDASSNCNITGVTVTVPIIEINQSFGNFTWNCTGQTGTELNINPLSVSFGDAVTGDFTLISTGSGSIRLANITPRVLDISGDFNISGGTFIVAILTGSGTVNVGGNFNMTGGTITETGSSSGLFVFDNGGTTQNFRRTIGTIASNISFTVNSNVTIDFGTNDYSDGGGIFTLSSGATLQTANTTGVNGSIQTTSRSLPASANYTFDGTAAQVTGTFLPSNVNNLTINNVTGITLTNTVTVAGTLYMNSGNISTGANSLILSNPLSSALNYTAGIVAGRLERFINTTSTNYFFPVGTTTQIQSLTTNFVNLTAGSLLVQYIVGDPGNSALPLTDGDGSQITNQFTTGYWSALAKNSLVSTNYNIDLNATGFGPYTINAGTRLIKRTDAGGSWLLNGTHSGAVGSVVKRTGMSGIYNAGGGTQFGIGKSGPKILTQPSNQTVCETATANFSLVATGYTLTYQWFKAPGTSLTNDGHFGGVNTSTFSITNVVSGDAGNYYCVVTDGYGSTVQSTSASLAVNASLPVSVTIAASANPVCSGTSVTFTATPVNGGITPAYQWYKGATPVGTGTATYTYTPVNGDVISVVLTSSETCKSGSPATSNNVTMTVNLILPVSVTIAASANPVCAGTSVTFTATPVNGGITPAYQWYKGAVPVGTGTPAFTYTPVNGDVISVVLTSSETCKSGSPATSNNVTMTVNPILPVSVTIAASTNPVCAGTSVTFTATPVNGGLTPAYQWYKGATPVGTGLSTYTFTPVNGDVISVVLTSSETCKSGSPATSNNVTMTVNALPVATFEYTGTLFCQNTANPFPTFLGGGVPGTFSSSIGLVFVSTVTGQINLAASLPGSYTVTNTISAAGGCSNVTATTNVTINPNPTVSIINPAAVCSPATVNLTVASITAGSTAGLTFTYWTDAAATLSYGTPSTAGAGTYYIKGAIVATGCYDIKPISVTVNPLPAAAAGAARAICLNASTMLGAGSVPGNTYSWSSVPAGFTSTIANPSVTPLVTTTYAVVEAITLTGCTNTNSVIVTVNPLPVATASNNGPVCAGSILNLTGGPAGMTTYSWTGPNGFSSSLQNPLVSSNITLAMAGVYTLTVTNASGCSNTATTTVAVNALPIATASNNGPVCAGSALNLTGGTAGMTTYSWTGPNGFSSVLQSPSVSASATVGMSGVYTLTVTNASGCTNTTTTTIVVNALPLVNITSSNSNMCITDLRTLTGSPAGGTFIVSGGPGTLTGNVLSATGTGNIYLEYKYTDVCTNKATQSIIVNETPVANAGPDEKLTFVFETQMKAEMLSSETGEWSLVSGAGHISDTQSPTTRITELSIGENIFLWKVRNGNCEASAEVKITVYDLFVPSVITPDGDGKNDYFKISENIGKVELIIFNRWGNEEYNNSNYSNDWDGRNNKGADLPNDTYFYILKFENGKIKKGSVLIKR